MNKTLKISFSLSNTYKTNTVLFSLKQIPLLKKLFPTEIYKVRGLKVFANIIAVFWEIISAFLGKFLYLFIIVQGMDIFYKSLPARELFLQILLLLTMIGSFMNTHLFNPEKDKYYAMFLMRMDAREYTLVNYAYYLIKVVIGFLPFILLFGRSLPLWLCLLLPFCIAGMKLFAAALILWDYEKEGKGYNENKLSKFRWLAIALLLALACALPAIGFILPYAVSALVFLLCIPMGAAGGRKLLHFRDYRTINRELLSEFAGQMDPLEKKKIVKETNEKAISTDKTISSNRRGFEYLNELFIKRHRKILWNSTKKISYACILLLMGALLAIFLRPDLKTGANEFIMQWLPYFVFIMYGLNRGTGFTQALFMNCDHSLLTYPFYKQSKSILLLFQIRLREIVKINAVPALIIGFGLALLLYATGGTDNPLNYPVLIVSLLCVSIFFSIHYLTIYYLLQPYNAGTEVKSATYKIIMLATYLVCFFLMKIRMPILTFGLMTIAFSVLYSIAASILVYRLAPKTFKIRT